MTAITTHINAAPKYTKLALGGLVIAILGLVIQWISEPSKFPGFPPGILVVAACGALVVLTIRWWWSPIFAVLISLWIIFGGFASKQLTDNIKNGNAGTVAGNTVMCLGLAAAAITGVWAMIQARRGRA